MTREALEQEPCEDAISRADVIDIINGGTTWASIFVDYLKDYARYRSGEIADLTYAASVRIAILSAKVKELEKGYEVKMANGIMDDCKFYEENFHRCMALTEMVCRKKECSFYKPRCVNDTNMGKGDADNKRSI